MRAEVFFMSIYKTAITCQGNFRNILIWDISTEVMKWRKPLKWSMSTRKAELTNTRHKHPPQQPNRSFISLTVAFLLLSQDHTEHWLSLAILLREKTAIYSMSKLNIFNFQKIWALSVCVEHGLLQFKNKQAFKICHRLQILLKKIQKCQHQE